MNQIEKIDLVEAAQRLRVPWHTAHRLVLVGTLKGNRKDGRWTVDLADLERLLADRSRTDRSVEEE